MILVNGIAERGAPWRTGRGAQLISDTDLDELFDFSLRVPGLSMGYYRHPSLFAFPHFILTPHLRRQAVLVGARSAVRGEFAAALERFRQRNPDLWISPKPR